MSTIQTVKTQIQSLIDLANTTTGNQDTNLTDGVNALVGGYGQGGSGGGTEIENGVNVVFYDMNENLLQVSTVASEKYVNKPPVLYDFKNESDVIVSFPLQVTENTNLYGFSPLDSIKLFSHFELDTVKYPYVMLCKMSSKTILTFLEEGAIKEIGTNVVVAYEKHLQLKYDASQSTLTDTLNFIYNNYNKTHLKNGNRVSQLNYVSNSSMQYYTNIVNTNLTDWITF